MINVADIKLGKKFYTAQAHRGFEVIKETSNAFYLAIFDGGCSKIDCISKSQHVAIGWFSSKKEADEFEVKELRRMADYIEGKINEAK